MDRDRQQLVTGRAGVERRVGGEVNLLDAVVVKMGRLPLFLVGGSYSYFFEICTFRRNKMYQASHILNIKFHKLG